MTYRKTWFSYVLWVVYTMLCVIFLVFAGNYVCENYFTGSLAQIGSLAVSFHEHALKIFGLLTVLVSAAAYWIVRGVSGQIRKKYTVKENTCRIVECVVVFVVLAVGIFLRVMRVQDYIQMQNSAKGDLLAYVNGIEYFDRAAVTQQGTIEPVAYGGAYLYILCLSFVLSFLGNKIVSAILLQAFLQMVGLILAYAVTRKAAGRIPACTMLLYLSCSPGYLEMLKDLGPECLFFVLYLLGMLAAVSYVKGCCGNGLRTVQLFAGAVLTGLLIGVLGYLDLTAFLILLVMTAVFTGRKTTPEDVLIRHSVGIRVAVVLTVWVSCAAGVCGAAGIFSLCKGNDFVQEIESWAALHIGHMGTFGLRLLYPYSMDMLLFGGLAVAASFLVFEFFRSGREQNYMLWILFCIVAAPTPLAVFGVQPFGLISMYVWGVLAGLGLQNCVLGGKAKMIQRMIEEINHTAEAAERAEESRQTEEAEQPEKADMPEQSEEVEHPEEAGQSDAVVEPEEAGESDVDMEPEEAGESDAAVESEEAGESDAAVESEEAGESDAAVEPEEAGQSEAAEQPEEIRKPRFLENPLPLPKKHVHKQMDYQYTVEECDMKFDVEIKEEDDFDI